MFWCHYWLPDWTPSLSLYIRIFYLSLFNKNICLYRFTLKIQCEPEVLNFKVTYLASLWNFMILPIVMFLRSRNYNGDICQNSITTGWPRKSSLNRKYWNFEVTHLFHWRKWYYLLCFFEESQWYNSHLENTVWTGNTGTSRLPILFPLVEFYDINIYVFEVEEFNGDTFKTLHLLWTGSFHAVEKMGNLEIPVFPVHRISEVSGSGRVLGIEFLDLENKN